MATKTSPTANTNFGMIGKFIVKEMKRLQVPGVALGIYHQGEELAAGFGVGVEKLGIEVLNPVSLRERVQRLAGDRIAGVAAQTRAGDLALDLLIAAYEKRDPKITGTVTIAWTCSPSQCRRAAISSVPSSPRFA